MFHYGWCNLDLTSAGKLSLERSGALHLCVEQPSYYYDGPLPSTIAAAPNAYMRDFPIDWTEPVAAKSPNSVIYESGQFHFSKELLQVPSIGDFRWNFGLSYQGDSDVYDILGYGWSYPQMEHLQLGLGNYNDEVKADRPIAHWSFGEIDRRVRDRCGIAPGSKVGTVLRTTDGPPLSNSIPSHCATFAGGGYVSIYPALDLVFDPSKHEFTIEVWAKWSFADPARGTIVGKGRGDTSLQYAIWVEGSRVYWSVGGVSSYHELDTGRSDEWHHLALVNRCVDRYAYPASFQFGLYIDGTLMWPSWKRSGTVTTPARLLFGATENAVGVPARFFQGSLDEVAVYDRALPEHRLERHAQFAQADPANKKYIRRITPQQTVQLYVDHEGLQNRYESSDGSSLYRIFTSEESPDYYDLVDRSGSVVRFHGLTAASQARGRIQKITDRFNRHQYYEWSYRAGTPNFQLDTIVDPLGRTTRYYYGSSESSDNGLLTRIDDSLDRTTRFQYIDHRLTAVVLPPITNGAGVPEEESDNRFPFGTAYAFGYDGEGRLDRIYYPNQVPLTSTTVDVTSVYQSAQPRVRVEQYETGTNRVLRELVGHEGQAGGHWQYTYERVSELESTPIWAPGERVRSRTTVTDPNGVKTQYDFNADRVPVRVETLPATESGFKLTMSGGPQLSPISLVTHLAHTQLKQQRLSILPEGNNVESFFDSGERFVPPTIPDEGISSQLAIRVPTRAGLLVKQVHRPDNRYGIGSPRSLNSITDAPASLERHFEYDPVFAQLCAASDFAGRVTKFVVDYQAMSYADALAHFSGSPVVGDQFADLVDEVRERLSTAPFNTDFVFSQSDVCADGVTDRGRGQVVAVLHPENRSEFFTYNFMGQMTTHTRSDGTVVVFSRYPDTYIGGVPTFAPSASAQTGWIRSVHTDTNDQQTKDLARLDTFHRLANRSPDAGEHQNASTLFKEYDPLGNPTVIEDVRGHETWIVRNNLGEPYQIQHLTPHVFLEEHHYDANRNLIRVDIEDKQPVADPSGAVQPQVISDTEAYVELAAGAGGATRPGWFVRSFEYDLLDQLTGEDVEATGSTPNVLSMRRQYDASGNLTKHSVQVSDATNDVRITEYDYDERHLLIMKRDGATSLTVMAYDGNGNLRHVLGPTHKADRPGTTGQATIRNAFGGSTLSHTGDWIQENVYDGYDRLESSIDALGNVTQQKTDRAGNAVEVQHYGHAAGPSPTVRTPSANLLALIKYSYDDADRVKIETQTPISGDEEDGLKTTYTYDPLGRTIAAVAPNDATTRWTYDGLGRARSEVDPLGNQQDVEYDKAGNPVKVTLLERTDNPGGFSETFVSRFRYDHLGRLVIESHQGADAKLEMSLGASSTLHTIHAHDSRGNQTHVITPRGDIVEQSYDGASRLIAICERLSGGTCATTTRTLDGNGLVTSLADPNSNVTSFSYDGLGRLLKTTYPSDTKESAKYRNTYDAAGLVSATDGNLTLVTYEYDAMRRPLEARYIPSEDSGVLGLTIQDWQYDGLSRLTRASDTDAMSAGVGSVIYTYDPLGRMTTESTGDFSISLTDFDMHTPRKMIYPNNREINWRFDALQRTVEAKDAGPLGRTAASWRFVGPDRVLQTALGNGIQSVHGHADLSRSAVQASHPAVWAGPCDEYLGYDGAGQMIGKRYLGLCRQTPIGEYRTTLQMVADNAAGWDYPRAHQRLALNDSASEVGTHQHTHHQQLMSSFPGWNFIRPHAGTGQPLCIDETCDRQYMVKQVTGANANFDFVRAAAITSLGKTR